MDIKKLYGEAVAVCGDIPLYAFLACIDRFARRAINRYGKAYTVLDGEYVTPDTLDGAFALDEAYKTALFYFILGELKGDGVLLEKSEKDAEDAYRSLWRAAAKGKRILKEAW